jgi:hypothetical protein
MSLKELVQDKGEKSLSLSRTIALITFIVLSVGFIVACYKRITYEFFISYPIGVMIVFVPALVVRFMDKLQSVIKAWKGVSE